jgi:hypothetical protein
MAYPVGVIRTETGKHRLHRPVFILSIICSCIHQTLVRRIVGDQRMQMICTPDAINSFQSVQFERHVVFPLMAPVDWALQNVVPQIMEIRLDEQPRTPGRAQLFPLEETVTKAGVPFFVEFYEDFLPWVKSKTHPKDSTKWPNVWQFGRIVRNAASHGRVNIRDEQFIPVTWHSLTYGRDQDGSQILGTDFFLADLVILMLEMNDVLDHLQCPIERPPSA